MHLLRATICWIDIDIWLLGVRWAIAEICPVKYPTRRSQMARRKEIGQEMLSECFQEVRLLQFTVCIITLSIVRFLCLAKSSSMNSAISLDRILYSTKQTKSKLG